MKPWRPPPPPALALPAVESVLLAAPLDAAVRSGSDGNNGENSQAAIGQNELTPKRWLRRSKGSSQESGDALPPCMRPAGLQRPMAAIGRAPPQARSGRRIGRAEGGASGGGSASPCLPALQPLLHVLNLQHPRIY